MRSLLPGIIAMAAVVVASNILVQFLVGPWLTWGAFVYPFSFLVTDLINRMQGPVVARRAVLFGFAIGAVCSLIGTQIFGEFGPLVTMRVALGSATAFLVAQLTDIAIFNRLRAGSWWRAPLFSTLVSASLDTVIFFSIAFSAVFVFIDPANVPTWATDELPLLGVGVTAPLWVSLAVADWGVKLALAMVALVPFRAIVGRLTAKVA